MTLVDQLVAVLVEHGYSRTPWVCRCGAPLEDSTTYRHVAEVIAALVGQEVAR